MQRLLVLWTREIYTKRNSIVLDLHMKQTFRYTMLNKLCYGLQCHNTSYTMYNMHTHIINAN